MNFNSKYSAQIRPVFRLLAVIISVPMILLECLIIFEVIFENKVDLQNSLKIAVPQLFLGLLFLIAGVKGKFPKWMDGEDENLSKRALCAKGLVGLFLIIYLNISIYYVLK